MTVIANTTFEVNTESYASWFSSTVVRDTGDSHSGVASLLCTSTSTTPGVIVSNFPGYSGIVAGNSYDFSLWYKESTATMAAVSWNIHWRNGSGTAITDVAISMPRATSWTKASGTFTAPALATVVALDFNVPTGLGSSGPAWRMDDVLIQDTPAAGVAPPPIIPLIQLQPFFG